MADATHRPDEPDPETERPRGGLDVFDAVHVRFPIRGETTAVREALATWVRDNPGADARTLLPEGVNHCTLFLDETPGAEALVWYVDAVDAGTAPWDEPAAAVRASPVFETLAALLGEPTVRADGVGGHRQMVNATHPDRQAWYEAAGGEPLVAPVAGDDLPIEVALVALPLRSRTVGWLAARTVDAVSWLQAHSPLGEWLEGDTEILAEERMYSESFLFDASDGPGVFYYYVETESMDQLYDAFEGSTDWKARLGEFLIRRVFERPEVLLEPPLVSDCEVLVHAVDPRRR